MKVRTTCLYLKRRKTSCTVYNLQRPSVRVSHLFLAPTGAQEVLIFVRLFVRPSVRPKLV